MDDSVQRRQIHLLLHAVDGCVPYLTPDILEKYFPPSDDLWIGIAVQDTCALPVYETIKRKDTNSKPTNGNANREKLADDAVKKQAQTSTNKPRGYTFGPARPDPWLIPYNRVTVPSFNLVQDNIERHPNQIKAPDVSSSANQIHLWTPHGRQILSTELYASAAEGLASHHTLSLYDMSNEASKKRQEKACLHNQLWLQGLLQRWRNETAPFGSKNIWAPLLIPPEESKTKEMLRDHIQSNLPNLAGVTLIGSWREGLEKQLEALEVSNIAVLSTESLRQFLDIGCCKRINVIGTDLPTRWAKAKIALGIDYTCTYERKRPKTEMFDNEVLDANGCLDMNDERFRSDSRPLVEGCSCLACKGNQFTRAYVHHLVRAKELLAEILLFAHNLHHLLQICRALSSTVNPEPLKSYFLNQLRSS